MIAMDTLADNPVVRPVALQLAAYNSGDIDLFMTAYASDVAIYTYPDALVLKGAAALRERYGSMFKQFPVLHAGLLGRTVVGNRVLDEESVTGRSPQPEHVMAIFTVEDGLIQEVRFIRSK